MNLIRLIVIVAIIWLVYRIYQNWQASRPIASKQQPKLNEVENMVQCSNCGVHLPEQEALIQNKLFYCCKAHKKQN